MTPQICGNHMIKKVVSSPSDAVALFRAALPKEQKEERVFVLPLDANGKILAKPILVSTRHQDGAFDCREAIRSAKRAKRVSRVAVARARETEHLGTRPSAFCDATTAVDAMQRLLPRHKFLCHPFNGRRRAN